MSNPYSMYNMNHDCQSSVSSSMTLNVMSGGVGQQSQSTTVPVFNILPYAGPRCDICGFTDADKNRVIQHIRTVHCVDDKSAVQKQEDLNHQQQMKQLNNTINRVHPLSNKKTKPFPCPICGKGFAQKIHVDTHQRNIHLKDRPYKCDHCDYSCANKGMLDKHVRIVHNKERPFKCQFCESSFGQKVHMDSHVNAVHIQSRPFKCDSCVYCATTKGLLDKHIRTVHEKQKPFVCEYCMSRFGQKAHLNKHIVTVHLKEKPYKCDHCSYQTSTKATLNKHVSVVHNKEKPFSCHLCANADFGQKAHLDKHVQQVHNIQSNPYKCAECSQCFATANNLKIHVISEHEGTHHLADLSRFGSNLS